MNDKLYLFLCIIYQFSIGTSKLELAVLILRVDIFKGFSKIQYSGAPSDSQRCKFFSIHRISMKLTVFTLHAILHGSFQR